MLLPDSLDSADLTRPPATSSSSRFTRAVRLAVSACDALTLAGYEELTSRLDAIADPTSPDFGRHMTHEEITNITATDAAAAVVTSFLKSKGANVLKSTSRGEYITASWSVQGWDEMLATEFLRFEHADGEILRALRYSLPTELVGLVHAVFNTVQVPAHDSDMLPL